MVEPGRGPTRFGPPDPDDLVGEASARLLAIGTTRPDRLVALRLLGLLADHTDADHRVRRPLADLAAEFDLDVAVLAPALAALAAVEVLTVDPDRGVVLAAGSSRSQDGLRLEAFLANVQRSVDAAPVVSLVDLHGTEDARGAHGATATGRPRLRILLGQRTAADGADTVHQEAAVTDDEAAPARLVLVPEVRGSNPWQRPLRAATAALVAAAASVVLAIGPEGSTPTTTRTVDEAASAADVSVPDDGGAVVGLGTTTVPSVRALDGRAAPAVDAPDTTLAAPPLDVLAPVPGEEGTTPEDGVPVPGQQPPTTLVLALEGTDPTPPAEEPAASPPPPCAPLAPLLAVVEVREGVAADPTAGRSTPVAIVEGSATNRLDRAITVDGLTLRVLLLDGTSRVVSTATPLPLAAGEALPWIVEVPLEDGVRITSAEAGPPTWRLSDGAPDDLCAP